MTAEMVRNAYQGIGGEYETLLKAFDRENEVFKKRVYQSRNCRKRKQLQRGEPAIPPEQEINYI